MPLFFITGIAGTGKTTVCRELKARGYEAYDADVDAYAKWRNKKTGYVHPKSSVRPQQRTEEFINTHAWVVPRQGLEPLAVKAKTETIYLCGAIANDNELQDLFDASFALVIDEETLKNRLQTRTSGDWGKQPHELQQTLGWQQSANEMYRQNGYTIIDATQPLETVLDEILNHTR